MPCSPNRPARAISERLAKRAAPWSGGGLGRTISRTPAITGAAAKNPVIASLSRTAGRSPYQYAYWNQVSGVARSGASPIDHSSRSPATVGTTTTNATKARPQPSQWPVDPSCRGARAPALGFIPDFLDEALVPLNAELDHHINEIGQQALDVAPGHFPPAGTLLHQQYQLLERELGARSVDTRDRAGVPRVDVPKIIKRLLRPKLGQKDPNRLH